MQSLDDILEMARQLAPDEREELIDRLGELEPDLEPSPSTYAALLALSGSIHSEHADLSTDKYTHLAGAISEHKSE